MAEINKKESTKLDICTQNRIELAWKCILEQYFEISKTNSKKEGPGLNIFKFLRTPKNDKSNCEYIYAEKDGVLWKDIFDISPDGEQLQKQYDSASMVAICVHVPLNLDKTVGNIKFFSMETKEEITKEEITKEEITKEEITKEEITKEEITKEEITKEEITKEEINKEEINKINTSKEV